MPVSGDLGCHEGRRRRHLVRAAHRGPLGGQWPQEALKFCGWIDGVTLQKNVPDQTQSLLGMCHRQVDRFPRRGEQYRRGQECEGASGELAGHEGLKSQRISQAQF